MRHIVVGVRFALACMVLFALRRPLCSSSLDTHATTSSYDTAKEKSTGFPVFTKTSAGNSERPIVPSVV
ncbi:uncharacterized protein BDZ99DRAFT_464459 [Mytilinidion resinicola]|uniref:Secreted protein n=1 Tax=Mytilinidion resinicola TaxID=574789 RepID=A0A6A6YII7_9PEZI|nr:uncharacterized protein BDZ99DRAFT_464459 [Mytilinidion resinicola]KAF2808611.1 hypothetical protein BDZ99DRAFT_464459 [Mytilinidion resinicola]